MTSLRSQMRYMNPYDIHKVLINEYVLKQPGDTSKLFQRDTSKDKTDNDVLRENHKFLWDDSTPDTWEAQFAKKYYDKLFKEYCIADLTLYRENKVALRWRIEHEVIVGKGQFICANKRCNIKENLRTWEVNFAYREQGERKNALVKIRLCPECSLKLNYRSKKREVQRLERKKHKKRPKRLRRGEGGNNSRDKGESSQTTTAQATDDDVVDETEDAETEESPWDKHKPVETKSRDEEMEEYLHDLLL